MLALMPSFVTLYGLGTVLLDMFGEFYVTSMVEGNEF